MTTLPYWHVDAFANRPFAGNQAAVMPLASWLSDATLQAIAEEKETVTEGHWATRDGLMRMDIAEGGSNLPYMLTQSTLSVPFAGARLTLYKR